jgi:hypothetical protein
MFGHQVQFNINKLDSHNTIFGGFMSINVNICLIGYLVYLIYKVKSGAYDNLTATTNFLELDKIKPVSYKDLDFLMFFTIYKQDMNESRAYPTMFTDDITRYIDVKFEQKIANWEESDDWNVAVKRKKVYKVR